MSAVNVALMAVAAQRKKVIDKLLQAEADCPERAVSPETLGRSLSGVLRHLRKEGIVVATGSGRLYLNRQRLAVRNLENRMAVQGVLGIAVAIALVAAIVALVHAA